MVIVNSGYDVPVNRVIPSEPNQTTFYAKKGFFTLEVLS